jgi:hypothetical protein
VRGRRLLVAALSTFVVGSPAAAQAAQTLYPDLKTLQPRNLRFDRTDVSQNSSGDLHNVLRFSNTVANEGEGPVQIRALIDQRLNPPAGPAFQRVFDDAGGYTDTQLGNSTLYYHAVHVHYHFDHWGEFQLWTRRSYDAWIASGRSVGSPDLVGQKTTSCVMDEEFVHPVPAAVYPDAYPAGSCMPNAGGVIAQGLSPGWGDTYDYYRFEQWIDLDQSRLADGDYVLRSVTDPLNLVYESPGKSDPARENQLDNEATTTFVVSRGQILDSDAPTGTVTLNRVDAVTSSPLVNLNVLGRDDVSGVTEFRVSTDSGSNWKTFTNTSRDSNDQRVTWDLSDPLYGGSNRAGTRTVCVLFKDATGKWGPLQTDTIDYQPPVPVVSAYGRAVQADAPSAWWRLGETSGTSAVDQTGGAAGTYTGGATRGQTSLVPTDTGNAAVLFNGTTGYVSVPDSSDLDVTSAVSLEAWIKPTSLPASGSFRSIVSKPEAYTLQFNGPRLEFTIVQGGVRRRLQAPVNAVVAGTAYHVAATYDGATQRLYLNGAQVASTALTGAVSTNAYPVFIGAWSDTQEFFGGTIDEPAVYGRALSAVQVRSHYDAGVTPALAVPSALAARASAPTQIDLSWTDNSSSETGQVLERSTDAAFTAPVAISIARDAQAYADGAVTASTTYWYRVKAVSGATSSAYSNVVQRTTPAAASYAGLIDGEHPVSYWRLGETSGTIAGDDTVVGPGTFLGSPILGVPSLLFNDTANTAIGFNGTTSDIRIGQTGAYDLTSAFSLESWIKPTFLPPAGRFGTIVAKPGSYALQVTETSLALTIVQAGVRRVLVTQPGTIAAGVTSHVVATFQSGTWNLYVNGRAVATQVLASVADLSMGGIRIGSWDGTQEFFAGTIDETAIYGSALTAQQVAAHHAGAKAALGEPTDLTASGATSSRVDLWWTDNSTTETAMVLQRSTTADFSSPMSMSLPASTGFYSDARLAAATAYWYRVRAVTASDSSAWSPIVLVRTPAASAYETAVATDAPVAWWTLDEPPFARSVMDRQGGASAVYAGATRLGRPSLVTSAPDSTAFAFDGIGSFVNVPASTALNVTSAISLEAWIKPASVPASGRFTSVISKPEAYTLQFNGPNLEFTIVQGATRRRLLAPAGGIVPGTAYHVVATYDGAAQRLYVNGRQVATVALTGAANTNSYPLFLGAWSNTMEFFDGTIDEPAIYGRALSAARVGAHYTAAS